MNRVVHFEIPADDMDRAKKFYGEVFGWQIMPYDNDTVMVATTESSEQMQPKEVGAINGDISKRSEDFKHPTVVIDVESIEEHGKKIEAAGGKSLGPKQEIPNMGFYAYFQDPEGNVLGLWETPKAE